MQVETQEGCLSPWTLRGLRSVEIANSPGHNLILLEVLGLGNDRFWRLRQDNCAINEIEARDGEFTLVSMNDTCHLRGEAV